MRHANLLEPAAISSLRDVLREASLGVSVKKTVSMPFWAINKQPFLSKLAGAIKIIWKSPNIGGCVLMGVKTAAVWVLVIDLLFKK